jgi:UDP-N-acetylglucosamine 2-epimerase (non-hydrolysing)
MDGVLAERQPDLTIVQGDTTSAFVCALASFYRGVPVAHVEAGLRTPSPLNPFPEEINRRLTSSLALLHFAPTDRARQALLTEGIRAEDVFVTGNTVVDALHQIRGSEPFKTAALPAAVDPRLRIVLVTMHRRENWGRVADVCGAVRDILEARPDVQVVWPVHPNPVVEERIRVELAGLSRVTLVDALDYLAFIALIEKSWIVLTDSGGVQEEAPVLGCPALVLRESTERPEGIEAGVARLVGTQRADIVASALAVLADDGARQSMARGVSPFGDGRAAGRIADVLVREGPRIHAYAELSGNPRRVPDASALESLAALEAVTVESGPTSS